MLLKGFIFVGEIEIKCRFCKKMVTVTGINGNLSNDHRYILIAEKDGTIDHVSGSATIHLGYSRDELIAKKVHEIIAFDASYYENLWKRLSEDQKSFVLFQTEHTAKSGKTLTVQVGARIFISAMGQKLFMFDVETRKPRKNLPKHPGIEVAPQTAPKKKRPGASAKKQTAQ